MNMQAETPCNQKVGGGYTASHTPGPWVADGFGDVWVETGVHRCGEMTRDICTVFKDADDWRMNAALIAAAPDLLAVLRLAFATLEPVYPSDSIVFEQMRAAIAKAEGRES